MINQQLSAICIELDPIVSVRVFSTFRLAQTSQYKGPLGTKLGTVVKQGTDPLNCRSLSASIQGQVDDSLVPSL
jgi:hypothetical protein